MRTHGHRAGNITHWGLLGSGGYRGGIVEEMGRDNITLREIPNADDGGMDAANHHGMCIPM